MTIYHFLAIGIIVLLIAVFFITYLLNKKTKELDHYNLLKKIREMDNSIKLGWLIYDVNDSIIKDCKNIKLNHVLCTAICLSKDEVTKLKNNNFIVSAWGVLGKSEINEGK